MGAHCVFLCPGGTATVSFEQTFLVLVVTGVTRGTFMWIERHMLRMYVATYHPQNFIGLPRLRDTVRSMFRKDLMGFFIMMALTTVVEAYGGFHLAVFGY